MSGKLFDLKPLSERQMKLVEHEVSELQIDVDKEVKKLIQWTNDQPHLPKYDDSAKKMKIFLHNREYDVDRCKETIDNYYSARILMPEYYRHNDPTHKSVIRAQSAFYVGWLPELTPEGYRVLVIRIRDVSLANPAEYYKLWVMMSEIYLHEDFNRGFIVFYDTDGLTFSLWMSNSWSMIRKIFFYTLECCPGRIKQIHTLNAPYFLAKSQKVIKTFLPKYIQERYFVHGRDVGYQPIHKVTRKQNIPIDLGGTLATLEEMSEFWKVKLLGYKTWFSKEESRKTDESQRDNGRGTIPVSDCVIC